MRHAEITHEGRANGAAYEPRAAGCTRRSLRMSDGPPTRRRRRRRQMPKDPGPQTWLNGMT